MGLGVVEEDFSRGPLRFEKTLDNNRPPHRPRTPSIKILTVLNERGTRPSPTRGPSKEQHHARGPSKVDCLYAKEHTYKVRARKRGIFSCHQRAKSMKMRANMCVHGVKTAKISFPEDHSGSGRPLTKNAERRTKLCDHSGVFL